MDTQHSLETGRLFPLDAPDGGPPPAAKDWAHAAARGVIADLQDRRQIKDCLNSNLSEDVRVEIIEALAAIIREAAASEPKF